MVLAVAGQSYALSVYDVIQLSGKGYSDEDIVALIEATGSGYMLKAEDVARLIELGVSDTVVQAMLRAVAVEPSKDSTIRPQPQELRIIPTAKVHDNAEKDHKPEGNADTQFIPEDSVATEWGSSVPFFEEASGGHTHRAVTFAGIRLLILRDKGEYTSIAARSNAVTRSLAKVASLGRGEFQPIHLDGGDAVVFHSRDPLSTVVILSVTVQDAHTYQKRSGRRVTSDLLAAYWSLLLADFWSIAVIGEPPTRLLHLHEGEVLRTLYDRVASLANSETPMLGAATQSLSRLERDHLLRLATTVPREFDIRDNHKGELR